MPEASELIVIAGILLAAGAATGILAGLFGVGGGALIVPVLYVVFGVLDYPESVRMPLAVGSSLAIIIPTSIRSLIAHRARGAVDMGLLRAWALPIVLGVAIGSLIARHAPALVFQAVFVAVASVNVVRLLTGARWQVAADLPRGWVLRAYGVVTGLLSSLMGIGGGQITNLVMMLHGRPIHQAVATSAGVGVLIAVPGAIGFALAGWGRADLPALTAGFLSLPGIALFVPMTVLTAGLGVRLAHRLSRRQLEVAFGLFLAAVCLRFLWDMLA